MAQPSTPQHVAGTVVDGFGQASTSFGDWSASTLNRLRTSVLPDSDEGATPFYAADSNDTIRPRSASQRALAVIPRVVVGAALALFLIAVGLFVFRQAYADRIYPAVVVGDVNVGGLTLAEAEDRLTERATELEQGTIAFTYQEQTWTPTLSELGASVNFDDSLAGAAALGRADDAAARLAFTGDILRADQIVPLRTQVDKQLLEAWFDGVDRDIANPAIDARIVVEGTDVSVVADETGIVVDREAATAVILEALARLEPVAVALPTQVDIPAIGTADMAEAEGTVRAALSQPVRVEFEGQAWRLEAEFLSGYLHVETVLENRAPVAKMGLDAERLAGDLRAQFVDQINRSPEDARVGWNDDRGLIALEPSQTGVTLKAGPFAEAVAASFLNGHEPVEIPVVVTRPEIDDENLDLLGIETRLGRGNSNYEGGSWERDHNIGVGTSLLNGTLVRPGEEFSFNRAIGEITDDKGYVEAAVVVAERVGKDIGGGICQVSTTMFRAAIYAGMPITEWHPHTYRLQGYEAEGWGPGFDASILQYGATPDHWADLRFENWTEGWLLVEAWTSYPHVIVNIYGPDTGNTVDIVGQWQGDSTTDNEDVEILTADLPAGAIQQIEWPMDGLEAGFTRVIHDSDGNEIANRQFYSNFKGRGNVYEVGIG